MTATAFPTLLGVDEVASLLGLHEDSVRQMCRDGRIPAVKFGHRWLIREDEVIRAVSPPVRSS